MHGDFRTHHQRQFVVAVMRRDDTGDAPAHVEFVTADRQRNYTVKAKYTEVIFAAAPIKKAVELCVSTGDCGAAGSAVANVAFGTLGIPPAPTATIFVASVAVSDAGEITVTPNATGGLVAADTFILTPSAIATDGKITWTVSGGCKTRAAGLLC